jgi:hypothetical protein
MPSLCTYLCNDSLGMIRVAGSRRPLPCLSQLLHQISNPHARGKSSLARNRIEDDPIACTQLAKRGGRLHRGWVPDAERL